jgi:hypothetical protein
MTHGSMAGAIMVSLAKSCQLCISAARPDTISFCSIHTALFQDEQQRCPASNALVTMAALMACTLLRCCGSTVEQDECAHDPPPPVVRRCHVQATPCKSDIASEEPSSDITAAQHNGICVLDADVLLLILARCELQDLARSARVGRAWF